MRRQIHAYHLLFVVQGFQLVPVGTLGQQRLLDIHDIGSAEEALLGRIAFGLHARTVLY